MFISKGFKALGCTIVPILIFSQTVMASPAVVFYQNATGQNVRVNYLDVLANAPMKTAFSKALSSAELNDLPIFILDSNESIINYTAAIDKSEDYATALTDPAVNQVTAPPVATQQMNVDGSVTLIASAVTVASVSSLNATTVIATLSSVPTVTPVLGDFEVRQSVDGAAATSLTPTLVMNGAVATFTVDPVVATTVDQSVVYSVSYKGSSKSSAASVVSSTLTTANVSTAAELATALANNRITAIIFTANITASPSITRPLTMNFGAYTLTGNVAFSYPGTGTSVLAGKAGNRIIGNLTVNTPKASFKNGVEVSGAVNVVNVGPGTWTESADGNTLTISDPDGASITVTGHPEAVTVLAAASGALTLTVNPGATVTSITSNAHVDIVVATGATVTNITAAVGSDGTTVTNNGTIGTVTADVPINLVANVAPTKTITEAAGSVAVSGTNAGKVVVVAANVAVSAISITGAATVVKGQILQMAANVTPTNATNKKVTWSVEPLVGGTAIVDATTGLLTATGVGTVTVKAVANDGSLVQATKVITVQAVTAATAVNLGTAGNYAILAETGISSVPSSIITGDIGDGPAAATYITGFTLTADATNKFSTSTQVIGKVYAANYAPPTPSNLTTAVSDMETAYTDAAGRAANFTELYTGDISGKTITPGVYKWSNSILINSDVTLNGGANDVFIFEIAGRITQASNTKVILTGGAQAKNIFWQSADTVSIGTGAHFEGNVLGMTNIALGTNASINGRLLAQSAVTLDQSTVVAPGSVAPTATATPIITRTPTAGNTSVSGTAVVGSSVVLTLNGIPQAPVTADGTGAWTVNLKAGLVSGNSISVTAQALGGVVSSKATATVVAAPLT